MVRVVKGNSELRIPDSEVTAYLRQGYAVVDASGSIVDVGKQLTYDELVTQYKQNTRTIRRQEAKIAELEAEVSRLHTIIAEEAAKTSANGVKEERRANGEAETKAAQRAGKA